MIPGWGNRLLSQVHSGGVSANQSLVKMYLVLVAKRKWETKSVSSIS